MTQQFTTHIIKRIYFSNGEQEKNANIRIEVYNRHQASEYWRIYLVGGFRKTKVWQVKTMNAAYKRFYEEVGRLYLADYFIRKESI